MSQAQNALLSDSVIREMFIGDISPNGSEIYDTPELAENQTTLDRLEKDLRATFTEEQKIIYESILDHAFDREAMREAEVFIYAFKLGMRMVLEATSKS